MTVTTTPPTTMRTIPPESARHNPVTMAVVGPGYLPESLVTLTGVSWGTYESLLADLADARSPRLTYDRGTLEIMSPSSPHERANRALALVIEMVAMEWDIHLLDFGTTTFRRADLERGFEPDTCFYIANVASVSGRRPIDPAIDPPPDLLIEMEVTTSAIPKLPLFAALGIPEVWRTTPEGVTILTLRDGDYVPVLASPAFPPLTTAVLTRFLDDGYTMERSPWLRSIRSWAVDHPHPGGGGERDEGDTSSGSPAE